MIVRRDLPLAFALAVAGCARSVAPASLPDAAPADVALDAIELPDVQPLPDPAHGGLITIAEGIDVGSSAPWVTVSFGDPSATIIERWLLDDVVGPCTLRHIDLPPSGPPTTLPSAGELSVSDAVRGVATTLAPNHTGQYAPTVRANSPFETGDLIAIRAAGGAVPAFATMSILPAAIYPTIVAPLISPAYVVDRATGLDFTWSGEPHTGDLRVVVTIVQQAPSSTAANRQIGAECTFDSPDDSAAIHVPAAALARFVPGGAAVTVGTRTVSSVVAGTFTIDVLAQRGDFGVDVMLH